MLALARFGLSRSCGIGAPGRLTITGPYALARSWPISVAASGTSTFGRYHKTRDSHDMDSSGYIELT
jgi:hypothetical protein